MENRKEIKEKMKSLVNQVEQMKESIGTKNAEIEMFENELGKLEQDKKTFEVYGYQWGEAVEINEEIEKTEEMLKELYEEKEKEDEAKKVEIEKVEGPVAEIAGVLAEIEMFEDEVENLKWEKQQYETYNHDWPELAEEKQAEIDKTEKQIDELYQELEKYKDIEVHFEKEPVNSAQNKEPEKEQPKQEELKESPVVISAKAKEEEKIEEAPVATPTKSKENAKKSPIITSSKAKEEPKEETALKEQSKWDKFRDSCKNIWNNVKKNWKKVALALGIGASAMAPTAMAHTEEVMRHGEKIEEKEVTRIEEVEEEINPNEIIENLNVGDIVTLKGDSELLYTSNLGIPAAVIKNLTKSGVDLDVMTTKIVGDKVHFSLVVDENGPTDFVVGGTSELLEKGELDNLPDELKAKLGTDIGWVAKEQLKDLMKKQTRTTQKEVKTTEQVKVPYDYVEEETTYTYFVRPDADKARNPEEPTREETEKGNIVYPGKERAQRPENENKASRIAKYRENAKGKSIDELLDEYGKIEESEFDKRIKIDNKDNHIEKNAVRTIKANESSINEKTAEQKEQEEK